MLSHIEREELIDALETLSRYTEKATGKPLPFQVMDYGMVLLNFENVQVSIGGLADKARVVDSSDIDDHELVPVLCRRSRHVSSLFNANELERRR
jgi:hypothetical protein